MTDRIRRVFVLTGAGISAESGIPTFRGPGGYWRNMDPTKLATVDAFTDDPETVWQWYRERREAIRRTEPNPAHQALVRLAASTHEFLLLTQNVDDLHARAEWEGRTLPAERIVQIHGDIFITRCIHGHFSRRDREAGSDGRDLPRCPRCDSIMRPGVVWFDEELDTREVRRVEDYLRAGPSDVVVVVGTTASFDYIIRWARQAALTHGQLIEVNPDPTPLSAYASETIPEPAAEALPRLVARLLAARAPVPPDSRLV